MTSKRVGFPYHRGGRGNDYPPDDGGCRWFWRYNWVCLKCRTHARRSPYRDKEPVCPRCNQPMAALSRRMALPKKNDPGWAKAFVKDGMVFWPGRKR